MLTANEMYNRNKTSTLLICMHCFENGGRMRTCMCSYVVFILCVWYAGIAVPQVLQYLREFDAPAMQSCIPLPCGIGSFQNRRLREQTLNRKPCHCGSIKGGWCMELPTSLDQPLQGQIVCACLDMFLPV